METVLSEDGVLIVRAQVKAEPEPESRKIEIQREAPKIDEKKD
jgi:hypothetical protein